MPRSLELADGLADYFVEMGILQREQVEFLWLWIVKDTDKADGGVSFIGTFINYLSNLEPLPSDTKEEQRSNQFREFLQLLLETISDPSLSKESEADQEFKKSLTIIMNHLMAFLAGSYQDEDSLSDIEDTFNVGRTYGRK
jgi:hypothetical protein